jgi:signal transduction histidine kinase
VNRLLRRLSLTLVVGLALAAALLLFTTPQAPHGLVRVSQMAFLKSDAPAPPGPDAAWVARSLPDNWLRTNPGQSGYGWYKATFDLPEVPLEAWAAYLPTVATTHRLLVNGVDVGGGPMTGPHHRSLGTPQFDTIAPQLLRPGSNELMVRLRVAPNLRGGLGPILLGPREEVEPLYDDAFLVRVTLPRAMNMALLFAGVLVLLLWLRRPGESIYGVFAALAIVWSLRNFHYTVSPPMPSHLWEAFILGSLGLVVVLLWIFMRRYTGLPPRRRERLLLAGTALSLPLLALLDPPAATALRLPWYIACAAFGAWSVLLLVRHVWRRGAQEGAGPWVILGALVLTLILGLADLAVSAQWLPFGPAARMAYGAPLLLCALVYALAENYFHTYDQARAHSAELERRVQERTAELERTHARLLALERKASVAAERERLMRDMHDGIGSQLITTLEAVERGSADGGEVTRLLRACMDDLRLMIDSLEPEEYSLLVALGNLRYRLEPRLRAAGVALEWAVEEGVRAPSPDATLHLLRIVQEAVTNALKHARASRLRIACHLEADALVLEVADNGCGFAATEARLTPATARRGLGNMLVRAHQLGGSLQRRDDGGGTRWVLRVPLEH